MNRHKDRRMDRQMERQMERQMDRRMDRQMDRQMDRYMDRRMDKQTDEQTDSQMDGHVNRQQFLQTFKIPRFNFQTWKVFAATVVPVLPGLKAIKRSSSSPRPRQIS